MKKKLLTSIFALLVCFLISAVPAKADSSYTMITPGTSMETAATLPDDGHDYVAAFE